ncbi:hypothetical protein AB0J74_04515 [Asanoa sp. NPDC049573]|uniref:hypothetical protein n=1 Tax=Asanoa sp. NPDC049573 TaxID=3155396 RepID=UPI003438D03E
MPLSRRTALLSLLAVPGLLTACTAAEPHPVVVPSAVPPPASPSPSPIDPRPALVAAAAALAKTSYKITETGDQTAVWQVHGPSRSFRLTSPADKDFESIQIGRDRWSVVDLRGTTDPNRPPLGGRRRWMHTSSAGSPLPDVIAGTLVATATDLAESTPGTFTGAVPESVTKDLSIFAADLALIPLDGPKPKPITWAGTGTITIRLDGQGRLALLAVEVPSADGRTAKKAAYAYSDYGKVGRPRKPPAKDVFELPSSLD